MAESVHTKVLLTSIDFLNEKDRFWQKYIRWLGLVLQLLYNIQRPIQSPVFNQQLNLTKKHATCDWYMGVVYTLRKQSPTR